MGKDRVVERDIMSRMADIFFIFCKYLEMEIHISRLCVISMITVGTQFKFKRSEQSLSSKMTIKIAIRGRYNYKKSRLVDKKLKTSLHDK